MSEHLSILTPSKSWRFCFHQTYHMVKLFPFFLSAILSSQTSLQMFVEGEAKLETSELISKDIRDAVGYRSGE